MPGKRSSRSRLAAVRVVFQTREKMAAPLFDFQSAREGFCEVVRATLQSIDDDVAPSIRSLEDLFGEINGSEMEKKMALDQAFRDVLISAIQNHGSKDEFLGVVTLSAVAVQSDICTASILFMLLQDIFDCFTLERCEEVFSFLEDRVAMWKSDTYYNAGKNYLLRMCNDLLRRLSRSKNTVFCGRIQLFLARLFPLSEKSGLNIMSQFNLENVTIYNTKPEEYDPVRKDSVDEKDESMEYEEGETADQPSNIPIDYNLYRKFWSLQDYFRRPTQCYDKVAWKTFTSNMEDVLNCFDSYKLEDTKSHKKSKSKSRKDNSDVFAEPPVGLQEDIVYFAKYLTSEKLLDLQLSDSNFRRYVLLQPLIIFQYLQAQVRFKSSSQVLTDDQVVWMKETAQKIYKALRETYPDGDQFASSIEHIMSREENWNNWKNDNCPSFIREAPTGKETSKLPAHTTRKRSMGDDLKASGGKIIKMGNSELTRLWNLCSDNVQACKVEHRNFLPLLEDFFEDAIEQMDPEAMVEDEYKLVKNPTFAWKSLRLLSRRSHNFFSQVPNAAQKKKSVPEYLEAMLAKLAKEMPSSQAEGEVKTEVDEGVDQESGESGMQDDQLEESKAEEDNDSQTPDESMMFLSNAHMQILAKKLKNDWQKLAAEVGVQDEDIAYYISETDDKEAQAMKMLVIWAENETEKVTVDFVRSALKEVGLEAVGTEVFGEAET